MAKYKTESCFSCGRYLTKPKPCENCTIIPYEGVVECIVCTKIIPIHDKNFYESLKHYSDSNKRKYMKRYCICRDCLKKAKNGKWKLKLKEPVTSGEATPDWR